MNNFDFDTLYPRRQTSSGKWRLLDQPLTAENGEIFPFSVADMDFKTAEPITKALHEAVDSAIFGYFTPPPAYYEAICQWQTARYNFSCQPQWIIQVPNLVYALYQLVAAFSESGDGVIVQPPVYGPFFHAVERQNRRLILNPLVEKDMYYTMDLDDLARKAKDPRARLMLICNPHNPVGRVWTKAELGAVLEICAQNDILVIVDEIHADLVFKPHRHTVAASLNKNAIILTAPSKSFNLPGLSTANLIIANQDLLRRFQQAQDRSGIHGANYLGTVACQAAYEKGAPWLDQLLDYLAGNIALFEDTVKTQFPQIRISPIEGTYLGWLDMQNLNLSAEERQAKLAQHQLHLITGSFFGQDHKDFERLNLALPRRALVAGLNRLADLIAELDQA